MEKLLKNLMSFSVDQLHVKIFLVNNLIAIFEMDKKRKMKMDPSNMVNENEEMETEESVLFGSIASQSIEKDDTSEESDGEEMYETVTVATQTSFDSSVDSEESDENDDEQPTTKSEDINIIDEQLVRSRIPKIKSTFNKEQAEVIIDSFKKMVMEIFEDVP